jgi:hypothetical protein
LLNMQTPDIQIILGVFFCYHPNIIQTFSLLYLNFGENKDEKHFKNRPPASQILLLSSIWTPCI